MSVLLERLGKVRPLTWILLIALLLRLLLVPVVSVHPQRAHAPDTGGYLAFAQAILQGEGWTFPGTSRTPGYPAFLAAGLALFGEHTVALVLFQAALATLNVLLTYLIARYFFNETISRVAALLLALNLESITHAIYLLSETFYTFLFLAFTFFLLAFLKTRQIRLVLLSGFLLGAAILTRPIAQYYPVIVAFLLVASGKNLRAGLAHGLLFILASAALVAPWVVRNQRLVGLATVSTISSHNLYFYNALSFEAGRRGLPEEALTDEYKLRLEQALAVRGLEDTEANRARVSSQLAREIILADPVRYALDHLKHDLNSLLPDTDLLEILGLNPGQKGTLAVLKQQGLMPAVRHYFGAETWMVLLLLPHTILLGFTYLGWGLATHLLLLKRRCLALAVLSLPVFYGLLLPGSPANPRFRVPVMPFICILAAAGLLFAREQWLQRNRTPAKDKDSQP
jgi:4-amino-4-deoxy-L-arabinose transferase-like glycosyltransferase